MTRAEAIKALIAGQEVEKIVGRREPIPLRWHEQHGIQQLADTPTLEWFNETGDVDCENCYRVVVNKQQKTKEPDSDRMSVVLDLLSAHRMNEVLDLLSAQSSHLEDIATHLESISSNFARLCLTKG